MVINHGKSEEEIALGISHTVVVFIFASSTSYRHGRRFKNSKVTIIGLITVHRI